MEMGIVHAGLLWMPMISKDFSVFPRPGEQAIAILLRSRFELAFQVRVRDNAEDLRYRQTKFLCIPRYDGGVWFVVNLEEFVGLLVGR